MDIYTKYGVDPSITSSDFLTLLENKKELTLRKLNNVFDNPEKEAELKRELDEIEATELIIKNGGSDSNSSTGLYQEEKVEAEVEVIKDNMDASKKLLEEGYILEEQGKYEQALMNYEMSANSGNPDAQFNLGYIYSNDKNCGLFSVRLDEDKAKFWYEKSAEQGNAAALNNLGAIYQNRNDMEKAMNYYEKAAEAGNVKAISNILDSYHRKPKPKETTYYVFNKDNEAATDYAYLYKWLKKYKNSVSDSYEKVKTQEKIDEIFSKIDSFISDLSDSMILKDDLEHLKHQKYDAKQYIKAMEEMINYADNEDKNVIQKKLLELKEKMEDAGGITESLTKHTKVMNFLRFFVPMIAFGIFYFMTQKNYHEYDGGGYSFKNLYIFWIAAEVITTLLTSRLKDVGGFFVGVLFSLIGSVLLVVAAFIALFVIGLLVFEIFKVFDNTYLNSFRLLLMIFMVCHLVLQRFFIKNKILS